MHPLRRQLILWYGLLETFVFTGNIFGWSALLHMLRQEGVYESACADPARNVTTQSQERHGYVTCEAQDSILNLAYTIGSFCMGATSFAWGFLLDRWGLRTVRLIINGLVTSGCILLSLTVRETSFLLFPSLILLCVAGVPLRLANMQIADLFPEKRSTIITLYTGGFSASASVFVFLKYGFDAGLPWEWACFLLVVLSALMLPATLFLLPARGFTSDGSAIFGEKKEREVTSVAPCVWGTYTYNPPDAFPVDKSQASKKSSAVTNGSFDLKKQMEKTERKEESPPLKDSLLSASFALHQYWFCWILLYTIIYVGTLHLWLERTVPDSSDGQGAFFSELYGVLQVSGIFLAPIGGLFMDWSIRRAVQDKEDQESTQLRVLRSCFWPMLLTTLLEAVAQACKYFDDASAIYVSIVAVTLLRAFFLSIGTAYLRIRFPGSHFNRLLGIMSTTSAVVTLFQFPLFLWESSSLKAVLQVNIFDSVCLAIALIHPILLVITPMQRYLLKPKKIVS